MYLFLIHTIVIQRGTDEVVKTMYLLRNEYIYVFFSYDKTRLHLIHTIYETLNLIISIVLELGQSLNKLIFIGKTQIITKLTQNT